jgi:hypothetical protein
MRKKSSPLFKKVSSTNKKNGKRLSARGAYDRGMEIGTPAQILQSNGKFVKKCLKMNINGTPYWGSC